ncbi:MAG TPA: hypothetical protein DDW96_04835, partial [Synergistaceae bacterium]|nr:hypothetical protein [Synergistaceae bacterium]
PGIKGVGDKTARALLAEHGSLEGVYEHLDEMKPALRKKLEEGRDTVFASRDLTRLRLDEPLREEDLRLEKRKEAELAALLDRFALKKLAERLLKGAPVVEAAAAEAPARAELSETSLETLLERDGLALGWSGTGNYPQDFSISEMCLCSDDGRFWKGGADAAVLEKISRWAEKGSVTTSGYKEICAASPSLLKDPARVWDARLAHYVLHPEVRGNGIVSASPVETMALWDTRKDLEPQVLSKQLERVMMYIDTPLCPVLASMERHGVRVDRELLTKLAGELDIRTAEISSRIDSMVGTHVNLNSTKQVAWLLFEKLGYPPVKKIKTGFSTDVSVLEELAALPLGDGEVPGML